MSIRSLAFGGGGQADAAPAWRPREGVEPTPTAVARWQPRMVEFSKMAFALCVSMEQKNDAKAAGAVWDGVRKAWFAPKGAEKALERFKARAREAVVGGANTDRDRVAALRSAGIDEDNPKVDGKIHRSPLIDGKRGSKDGAYVFFDDGAARGVIWNHKTGLKMTWACSDAQQAELSPTQRAALAAHDELTRYQRAAEIEANHQAAAAEARALWNALPAQTDHCPYASRKNIGLYGVKTWRGALIVPARDIDGKLWTLQTIAPEAGGMKKFMAGGKKAGCFHLIGEIQQGATIFVAEGYATAATLHEATGCPVVVAFDAGNLLPVGKALAARHPASMLAFMADNDQYGPVNVGVEKARAAAEAVGGVSASPVFASTATKPTDWNDLAALEGLDAVRRVAVESLRGERARLRQACFERARAQNMTARRLPVNSRSGRYIGVIQTFPGGLCALHDPRGDVAIHETRLIEGALVDGRRVIIEYDNGRGCAKLLPAAVVERDHAQAR